GGSLQRLASLLVSQLLSRQPAQLVVDKRQKLLRGVRIALLNGGQDAGHFGHVTECRVRSPDPQWCSATGTDVLPAAPVSRKDALCLRCKSSRNTSSARGGSRSRRPEVGTLGPSRSSEESVAPRQHQNSAPVSVKWVYAGA